MKIIIVNGPNLNLLGIREKSIYGSSSFIDYYESIVSRFPDIEFDYFQSNVEGELINYLQEVGFSAHGIVFNAGAYTHTSIAISDAIAAIRTPVVEVHISNVMKRESFRHVSMIAANCRGTITGFGLNSYLLGVESFVRHVE